MNISDMNKKIKIQTFTTIQNDNGFDEETWVDFKQVWCAINNLNGREFWAAKAVQAEATVNFIIRYADFVKNLDTKKYRIINGKRTINTYDDNGIVIDAKEIDCIFNIIFINNVNNKNKFVEIKALLEVV